jgi:cytochrome oxidase assembly protein ShyY1
MAGALTPARRRFAPRPLFTVLTLAACALFVRLGFWQWHKFGDRQLEWTRFARGADTLLELGARSLDEVPLYQRVSLTGTLDGTHQYLLDNRTYRGRAGYEVLTPLVRGAGRPLLLDRGWVPFSGSRRELPVVTPPAAAAQPVTLSGRVAQLPAAGLAAGHAAPDPHAPWPKVTSFPSPGELSDAYGGPLEARIVLLDAAAPFGYVRDWQPPGMTPLRHFSYALQWWSFAALAIVVWAVMSIKRIP